MSSTQEVWVDIRNYEGYYQISNKGRIKSLEREVSHDGITYTQPERILCHWCGTTSLYDRVRLYKEGIGTKFTVHRLVAEYFLEDWNPRLEVNHLDGNRYNNAADNLEMCTHQRRIWIRTRKKCWSILLNRWKTNVVWTEQQQSHICVLILLKKSVMKRL